MTSRKPRRVELDVDLVQDALLAKPLRELRRLDHGGERYPEMRRRYRSGIFERFTERARQVVVLAQDEARALRHNYIGTEHLLLGLLREEEGLAARVLESLDITVEEVRAAGRPHRRSGRRRHERADPVHTRARRRCSSSRSARRSRSATTTSAPSTSCSGSCARTRGSRRRILLDFDADAETIRDEIIRMLSRPARPDLELELGRTYRSTRRTQWSHRVERWPAADPGDLVASSTGSARRAGSCRR